MNYSSGLSVGSQLYVTYGQKMSLQEAQEALAQVGFNAVRFKHVNLVLGPPVMEEERGLLSGYREGRIILKRRSTVLSENRMHVGFHYTGDAFQMTATTDYDEILGDFRRQGRFCRAELTFNEASPFIRMIKRDPSSLRLRVGDLLRAVRQKNPIAEMRVLPKLRHIPLEETETRRWSLNIVNLDPWKRTSAAEGIHVMKNIDGDSLMVRRFHPESALGLSLSLVFLDPFGVNAAAYLEAFNPLLALYKEARASKTGPHFSSSGSLFSGVPGSDG